MKKKKASNKRKHRRIVNPSPKQLKQWASFTNVVSRAKEIYHGGSTKTGKAWQEAMQKAGKEIKAANQVVLSDEMIEGLQQMIVE